jgi:two-component system, chemotaxis family, protein-glutamate methylesterase/glutaminase
MEPKYIIVIGASAGGLQAVTELMAQITEEMDAAIFVVLHLNKTGIGEAIIERINRNTIFNCKLAEDGEEIKSNHLYLAKPNKHLIVKKGKILLGLGALENRYRPSIDVLFRSAAVAYNSRTIGVILSGLLEDGTSGMKVIKDCGGISIVQNPLEAEYPDMPKSVMRHVKVDYCTTLQNIAFILQEKIKNDVEKEHLIPDHIQKEAEIAENVAQGIENVEALGVKSAYSCSECGGALWELKEEGLTRYRCHTGHAFTANDLLDGKKKELESTFWITLRILEERRNLLIKIAEEEKSKGWERSATNKLERVKELKVHINRIREILFDVTETNDLEKTG